MDTRAKFWMMVAIGLFFVMIAMLVILITVPAQSNSIVATSTPTSATTSDQAVVPRDVLDGPLRDRVVLRTPSQNTTVGNTFVVSGSAPGNWFFEADFPLQVRDREGNVIARTFASAEGEWMTTELVSFSATVHVDAPYSGQATLILLKNNPSGLPEHDDALEIPIVIE
jgi:hypothetical protein